MIDNENKYSSELLNDAVAEFAKLPGIGNKTALRLVLYLLKKPEKEIETFGETIIKLRKNIKKCKICKNVSDSEVCNVCSDQRRINNLICVVENINDVIAIEKTGQFKGLYHVLGGLISPMDGIGPDNLEIDSLTERISKGNIREIILALNSTPEGDTTNFYIHKKIKQFNVKTTIPARGVSVGSELQYTDQITLGRSIINRIEFSL